MKKIIIMLLVTGVLAVVHKAMASTDGFSLMAVSNGQGTIVSVKEIGGTTTILHIQNSSNAPEPEWSIPLGRAGVSMIQFLNSHDVAVAVCFNGYVRLYFFNIDNSTSVRMVKVMDSCNVQKFYHLNEERVFVKAGSRYIFLTTTELGGKHRVFAKRVDLNKLTVDNVAAFSAGHTLYFGWRVYVQSGIWDPVIMVTNGNGRTRSFEVINGITKEIDAFQLPPSTSVIFGMYSEAVRSLRINTPAVSEWTPLTE